MIRAYSDDTDDRMLAEIQPRFIIMFEPCVEFIRRVEVCVVYFSLHRQLLRLRLSSFCFRFIGARMQVLRYECIIWFTPIPVKSIGTSPRSGKRKRHLRGW